MSEYQYYEFQAIDRPLSEREQAEVRKLSSRVDLTPTRAVFVYNYGDFRGDPEEVLARYFDAMLYLANWGSRRLMFRFPKALIELDEIEPYCLEDSISLSVVGEHVILDIDFDDEESAGWLDGEGWLPAFLGLRDDILQRDYRLLYLAWLKAITVAYDLDEDAYEPPIPAGLRSLAAALDDFVDLFEIDDCLLQVAAQASGKAQEISDDTLRQALGRLPEAERDSFLWRLVRAEPNLPAALNRRLSELADLASGAAAPQRTIRQLLRAADQAREEEQSRAAEEAERRRIEALQELAVREEQVWQEVEALIQEKKAKAYGEAVARLVQLRDLAVYQEKEAAFEERLRQLRARYTKLLALNSRLDKAGLS